MTARAVRRRRWSSAPPSCSPSRCTATSARAPGTASPRPRRSLAWDRFRFLPQVLRDVTRVDLRTSLLGTPLRSPLAVAPTDAAARRPPRRRGRRWPAGSPPPGPCWCVSSNAGSTFEDIAATGVAWWSGLRHRGPRRRACRSLERAVAAGAAAVVLTVDTPVVGTKYDGAGPTVWDVLEPGWLQANFPPGYGDAAGDAKATDLGPQDVEWLAPGHRPARWWSRACCAPTTPAAASTRARPPSGCPTTAVASSTRPPPPPTCLADRRRRGGRRRRGVRRRGSAHGRARAGRARPRGRGRLPRPATGLCTGRRRRGRA